MKTSSLQRLTIATCIGCGAMSVPSQCAGGCGSERKLELVPSAELDDLVSVQRAAQRRAQAMGEVLSGFLATPSQEIQRRARVALRTHDHDFPGAVAALAAEPDPVVSWWCEDCGGLEAPAPCVGVCVRRPAQWATLDALQRQREATGRCLDTERGLAGAIRALALTRPRPGSEPAHRQALREMAAHALTERPEPRAGPKDAERRHSA